MRDYPGGPVAETPCSQCRGPGFDPWSGNWLPYATTKTWHSQIKNKQAKKHLNLKKIFFGGYFFCPDAFFQAVLWSQ